MCSDGSNATLLALGFPIRKSTGQRLLNASPWLIAVVHVLHRLQVPRHPPCALTILTVIPTTPCIQRCQGDTRPHNPNVRRQIMGITCCVVFKGRRRANQLTKPAGRSLKTQQHEQSPPSLDAGNSDQVRSTFRTKPLVRNGCSSFRAP